MAVPAALIPPTPLVPQPPISTTSATSSPSTTSSPSPSVAPSGQNLFRSEPINNSNSPGIPVGSLPSKPVYSTPSPVENTPQNNECKMVDLRGAKVASFTVESCELICLPQAFDLFLKHLVGGLHTVYTKLKRLEITPVVCNVEQVRILRGLGAIQPGVNRCKLISRKDFETLYNDCTNASSRPGRPPKRTQSVTSPENQHIMPHTVPGLMSPGIIAPTVAGFHPLFYRFHSDTDDILKDSDKCRQTTADAEFCRGFLQAAQRLPGAHLHDVNTFKSRYYLGSGLSAAAAAAAAATNAAIAEAMKVKKIKLEVMSSYHSSNNQHGADSENGDLNSSVGSCDVSWDKEKLQSPNAQGLQASVTHPSLPGQHKRSVSHPLNPLQQNHLLPNGLELPFMMMPHPLIPVSLPPASVTMAMSQMNHLSTIANMAAAAQVQSPPCRVETSVIKERVPDSPSPAPSLEDGRRPGSHPSSHRSSSVSSSPARTESSLDRIPVHQNGLSMNQTLMGLSPNVVPGPKEGDLATHDMGHEAKRIHLEKDETPLCTPTARDSFERLSLAGQHLPPGFPSPFLFPDGLSSIETLLTNIQGLLKVAIDNARAQEKQIQMEKTELKMELFRERELRETIEKQLAVEQKNRAIIQKRLKKEKKAKRKLQEALEYETKRRDQAEQTLKQAASTDSLRALNESLTQEMEADRGSGRTDAERTIQDGRLFLKTSVMY
ncbi:dachshund homolog 1-like isoform X1 [Acipenser ruthenus]|uniref:dachshund homolog 1-like isoform X1 n=1 Tax=Acipenser ruthenus TaxID=7906 RepID=UPI00274217B7|nr:dachshund homolog 1-like isoform X1 [Acipenser ruthenus]